MPIQLTRRRRAGARGGDARRLRRVAELVLESEGAADREATLLLTDDAEIHDLNRRFRGKDKPTDVLAFAYDEDTEAPDAAALAADLASALGDPEVLAALGLSTADAAAPRAPVAGQPLGDVIVSVERAEAQARARRTPLDQELELLVVHGTLHLLGYDHGAPEEARVMRNRTRALRRLAARRLG